MRYPSIPLFLVFSAALAACTPGGGDWPSLARVPGSPAGPCGGERDAPAAGGRPCAAAPSPGVTAAAPALPVDVSALVQRFAAARAAWQDQLRTAESAVDAAARADTGESAWAAAELQLSRLERAAAPFTEIADALAGDDSTQADALRADVEAARARHTEAFGRLRGALR